MWYVVKHNNGGRFAKAWSDTRHYRHIAAGEAAREPRPHEGGAFAPRRSPQLIFASKTMSFGSCSPRAL